MDELFPMMEDTTADDYESHIDVFDDDEELDELRFSETSTSDHDEEEEEEVFSEPDDGIVIDAETSHNRTTPSSVIDLSISN